jgi:hypothetical protein
MADPWAVTRVSGLNIVDYPWKTPTFCVGVTSPWVILPLAVKIVAAECNICFFRLVSEQYHEMV